MSVICPCCHQAVDENAIFCDICGAPLKEQEQAVPCPTPATPAPPQAVSQSSASAQAAVCPNCGAPYVAGEIFCNDCGVQLPPVAVSAPVPPVPVQQGEVPPVANIPTPPVPVQPAVPQVEQPVPATSPEQAQSIITTPQGPFIIGSLVVQGTSTVIPLPPGKTEILIGRVDPISSIFPEIDTTLYGGIERGVSRKHCRLVMDGDTICIEDLGSANYTYVNRVRLQPGQHIPINPGDEIRLGGLVFTYMP
jgi:hypothetical protein